MQKSKLKVTAGALLHDIGKPAYRGDKSKNHSISGYEFLKDTVGIKDTEILEQVKYHHKNMIQDSSITDNSLAYITYIADNIASGADRRKVDENQGFDMDMQLESVFNILNGNNQHYKYKPQTMENGINYPIENEISFSKEIYKKILWSLLMKLKVPNEEASNIIGEIGGHGMGYLFENMDEMDIQAERRNTAREKKRADALEEEVKRLRKLLEIQGQK